MFKEFLHSSGYWAKTIIKLNERALEHNLETTGVKNIVRGRPIDKLHDLG